MAAHEIAQKLIDGKVCAQELVNTQFAYQNCIDDHHPSIAWWQQPEVEIAGITVTFSLGLLVGLTHCFGSCK